MSVTKIFKYELFFQPLTIYLKIILMAASSSRQFKNICVLSGFHYEKYKDFIQATVDRGRVIVERKLHLVYGGGDRRLSKLVLEVVFIIGN